MIRTNSMGRILACLVAILCASVSARADFLSRKQAKHCPRGRVACLPSPTMGTRYFNADDLGKHSYGFSLWEKNGIVYTCHGGHVDVTHLRKVADWTAYLAYHLHDTLMHDLTEMSYKMWEPSRYYVEFEYPAGWTYLPDRSKDAIAREVAIDLASYLAYTASVWHEVLTWHGFKGAGIYPEYHSAFSWEDNYSNAMGARLGAMALRDREHDYEEALTRYLDQEIQRLGGQPKRAAREAGEAVRGSWFKGGYLIVTMVTRHLDTGFDDGTITPWLVPGIGGCPEPEPWLCPIPNLEVVTKRGFNVSIEIEPREWEKGKILRKAYPNTEDRPKRIDPTEHLEVVIEAIRAEALERYGPDADQYAMPGDLVEADGESHQPGASEPVADAKDSAQGR